MESLKIRTPNNTTSIIRPKIFERGFGAPENRIPGKKYLNYTTYLKHSGLDLVIQEIQDTYQSYLNYITYPKYLP